MWSGKRRKTVLDRDIPRLDAEYDNELSLQQQKQLTEQLLIERQPSTNSQFAYYELSSETEAANIARTIEANCFNEFFKETPAELRSLYGPYEKQSTFFLAVDTSIGMPVGALRVIANGANGLLTLNDLSSPAIAEKGIGGISVDSIRQHHDIENLDACWDIGAVAVLPEHRGKKKVSVMLYRAMYKKAKEQGIEHLVSIIDKHPYEGSIQPLRIPFQPLAGCGEPFRYYGSKLSYAVHGRVDDFFPTMYRYLRSPQGWLVDIVAQGALSRLIMGKRDNEIQFLS